MNDKEIMNDLVDEFAAKIILMMNIDKATSKQVKLQSTDTITKDEEVERVCAILQTMSYAIRKGAMAGVCMGVYGTINQKYKQDYGYSLSEDKIREGVAKWQCSHTYEEFGLVPERNLVEPYTKVLSQEEVDACIEFVGDKVDTILTDENPITENERKLAQEAGMSSEEDIRKYVAGYRVAQASVVSAELEAENDEILTEAHKGVDEDIFGEGANTQVTPENVDDIIHKALEDALQNMDTYVQQAEDSREGIAYTSNKVKVCGKVLDITEAKTSYDGDFKEYSVAQIKHEITQIFLKDFNISNTVAIVEDVVIVNGIAWFPNFRDVSYDKLPLDIRGYLQSGAMAYLLDWGSVMSRLKPKVLSIDSEQFAYSVFAVELHPNHKGRVGLSTFFNYIPSLMLLEIGSDCIKRSELETPKADTMKEKAVKQRRFSSLLGGYSISVSRGTQSLQDWSFKNLRDYANNRGDKGFLRYSAGVVLRTVGATASGILNLVGHVGHGIKTFVKGSVTPVTTDEVMETDED